jgi:hypothetical protein
MQAIQGNEIKRYEILHARAHIGTHSLSHTKLTHKTQ